MINTYESVKQKRELLRLQLRKQSLNDEFSKKRNIRQTQKNTTPIDEILNQVYTYSQQPLNQVTITECLKLITGHQDICDILNKTGQLIGDILKSFCIGAYNVDNVMYYLLYFDSLLLFNELVYLEIKKVGLDFMNNLKLILVNQEFNTLGNIRTIINIFQSLLIDCPTIFSQFIILEGELVSVLTQINLRIESKLIQQSMIELFFHIMRFYNFEEDVPEKLLALLINFYFSIIDSTSNLLEIEFLPLYIKSGKYLFKICDQYPIYESQRFPQYLQILQKCQDLLPNSPEEEISIFYSAKVAWQLWRLFIKTSSSHQTAMILLQKIIINEQFQISKIGFEILKEIIEAQYSQEFLIFLMTGQFQCRKGTINLLNYLILEIQNKEESYIILKLEVIDSIFKSEYNELKSILINKDIFNYFKTLLNEEYNVQIHLQIVEILTSIVLDESLSLKIANFPEILKNIGHKNKMLTYKIDNLLQLYELQE